MLLCIMCSPSHGPPSSISRHHTSPGLAEPCEPPPRPTRGRELGSSSKYQPGGFCYLPPRFSMWNGDIHLLLSLSPNLKKFLFYFCLCCIFIYARRFSLVAGSRGCSSVCGAWASHCGGCSCWASLVAQTVRCLLAVQETWVRSLGWEEPLEKEMATHSSTLAWKITWMEEPGRLQSMGSQRVSHD